MAITPENTENLCRLMQPFGIKSGLAIEGIKRIFFVIKSIVTYFLNAKYQQR